MKYLIPLFALVLLAGCDPHIGYHTESHSRPAPPLTDPSMATLMGQDGTFAEPATMLVGLPGDGVTFTLGDGTVISLPTRSGVVGVYSVTMVGRSLTVDKSDGSSANWFVRAIAN